MAFWQEFKEGLYQRKLKKSVSAKVKRKPIRMNDARNIGILFDATDESSHKTILDYANELKQRRKKVSLLAFFDGKECPESFSFPCFCNKDLGMSKIGRAHV